MPRTLAIAAAVLAMAAAPPALARVAPLSPEQRLMVATWQNNGGLWQIVHEKVSADKPVTDERIAWP